jgi:hypothetical protein
MCSVTVISNGDDMIHCKTTSESQVIVMVQNKEKKMIYITLYT